MQGIFSNFIRFSLLAFVLVLSNCSSDDDPILGGSMTNTPPTISLTPGTGLISGDAEIELGSNIDIRISLLQGDNPLRSFTITEDGINVSPSRLTIDGGATTAQNPFLILGNAVSGADYDITITTDAGVKESRVYEIVLTDEANNTDNVQFQVTVGGTPTTEIVGILLNQGGPQGTGGLNLITGQGTGTDPASDPNAVDAHIKDEGIDTDKVMAENWKQRISGLNGSVIKVPGTGNGENFSYDDVNTVEEILTAFDAADVLTETNTDGELISDIVNVDDVFLVQNGQSYWILKVTDVNVTTDDNSDSYEFSIKQ